MPRPEAAKCSADMAQDAGDEAAFIDVSHAPMAAGLPTPGPTSCSNSVWRCWLGPIS